MLGKNLLSNFGWSINMMLCSFFFWIWFSSQPTGTQLLTVLCTLTFLDVLSQVSSLNLSV